MYILTKDGKVIEGEVLTDEQALVHIQLPDVLRKCSTAFVGTQDSKYLAAHLIKHFEMRLRPVEVEPEVASDPDPVVESLDYPAPTPPEEFPGF